MRRPIGSPHFASGESAAVLVLLDRIPELLGILVSPTNDRVYHGAGLGLVLIPLSSVCGNDVAVVSTKSPSPCTVFSFVYDASRHSFNPLCQISNSFPEWAAELDPI